MSFEKLNLIQPILKAIENQGYEKPTPIQEEAIPIILDGRDLIGCAQTGTGKTAAFAIPILQKLATDDRRDEKKGKIKALILTPTRELALQIDESFTKYGKYLGYHNNVVFGGVSQDGQVGALKSGVDILVATPGRLLDLTWQGYIDFGNIDLFVLDEADRMLDMGFAPDVKNIIRLLPEKRQNLLFSATMPPEIDEFASVLLENPKRVAVDPVSSTVDSVEQLLYNVSHKDKTKLLIQLLKSNDVETALVFTKTKRGADRTVAELKKAGVRADVIHGDKTQASREYALDKFKQRKVNVLVATDVMSRGMDISALSHVINYDAPGAPEDYVHRIGRTARAGKTGVAITFCDRDEIKHIGRIQELIEKKIKIVDHKYSNRKTQPTRKAAPHRPSGGNVNQTQKTGNTKTGNTKTGNTKTGNTKTIQQKVVKPGPAKPEANRKTEEKPAQNKVRAGKPPVVKKGDKAGGYVSYRRKAEMARAKKKKKANAKKKSLLEKLKDGITGN